MIVLREHGVVIATPTKCGTNSFMNMLHLVPGYEATRTLHTMVIPEGYEQFARIMAVRNPYDRLTSVYEYLKWIPSEWGHKEVVHQSWKQFLSWFLERRSLAEEDRERLGLKDAAFEFRNAPWKWTNGLTRCADVFKPDMLLPLELGDEILDVLREFGVVPSGKKKGKMYRANTSPGKRDGRGWQTYYGSGEEVELANAIWCDEDVRRLRRIPSVGSQYQRLAS